MEFRNIADRIIQMKNADLKLRDQLLRDGELEKGYNAAMEVLHNKNATILHEIIERIGYPTLDKVGKEASEAAWLIIQHSIGQPNFMKSCAKLLEIAVSNNNADPLHLAYLMDRIATFEGKPQLYGTQFDWDEYGKMNPLPIDDLMKVNNRRKSVGLNSIQEQTLVMRERVKNENQIPPNDLEKRRQHYDDWRKKVGWLK